MNKYTKKAMQLVEDARPASGFRPETESEWVALQTATIEFGFAMFRESGMSAKHAREAAQMIYGGSLGRRLLDVAYRDDSHG